MPIRDLCEKIIRYSFYTLFFLVPLIWLPITSELFEFNKMILVYLLTTVIVTAWLIKSFEEKQFSIRRTPLDLTLVLFLLASLLATIFSIDPHTSLFGYYGRFNGGFLSTLSYVLLYFAFVSNVSVKEMFNYLYVLLVSGFAVALYGVLQHPNPLFARSENGQIVFHGIDFDYWAVNAEERVFSTLGQPNWLAAFLAMLIFPLTTLLFILPKIWQKAFLLLGVALTYLAFTFTYSRGGALGLLAGIITFQVFLINFKKISFNFSWVLRLKKLPPIFKKPQKLFSEIIDNILEKPSEKLLKLASFPQFWIAAILLIFFTTNFFFGNAIARRTSLPNIAPESQPTTQTEVATQTVKQTQLEVQGKETAEIRLIVWKGALEIFKHYPIVGTGLETFGYSYYLYRPADHNYVSEWDYLYNKAHNEYVNYLSTSGIIGTGTYLFLILFFEFLVIKYLFKTPKNTTRLIALALLAGYNSYLVQNFFGFSVVPIAVLFFLYPAMFFILTENKPKKINFNLEKNKLLKESYGNNSAKIITGILGSIIFLFIWSMWFADIFYSSGSSSPNYSTSIDKLRISTKLNIFEPLYKAELATNLAGLATVTKDAQTKEHSKDEAQTIIKNLVKAHPNNLALWRMKRTIDFNLAKIDKATELELLTTAEKLKTLAPTDASTQYDVALVYAFVNKKEDAEKQLENVLALKNDYKEATITLAETYVSGDKREKAISLLQDWLKKYPADQEAANLLRQLLLT